MTIKKRISKIYLSQEGNSKTPKWFAGSKVVYVKWKISYKTDKPKCCLLENLMNEPTFHASFPMSRRAKSEESTCFQWNVSIAVYMKLFSLSVKKCERR